MLSEKTRDALIAAIYEAALDFEQWPVVIGLLSEALGATGGCLLRQERGKRAGFMSSSRSDPEFGRLYHQY
jgi:hypothetical protein